MTEDRRQNMNCQFQSRRRKTVLGLRAVIIFCTLGSLANSESIQIPLAYAFSPDRQQKYPIELSFDSVETFTPFQSTTLHLYNLDLPLLTERLRTSSPNPQKVIIGLKHPSQFLASVQHYFGTTTQQIQFQKDEFLKLIIGDLSFIESRDVFVNNDKYDIDVQYNFGQSINIESQTVELEGGRQLFFNEIVLRRILINLSKKNQIEYKFHESNHTVSLKGNLRNFPKLKVVKGTYLFQIDVQKLTENRVLRYVPSDIELTDVADSDQELKSYSSKQPLKVGIDLLSRFSKFQIIENQIIFKRTSSLYMLYLFLGYVVGFCLFIIIKNRNDHFKTTEFVRSIFRWIVLKDRNARVQVLRTELEEIQR